MGWGVDWATPGHAVLQRGRRQLTGHRIFAAIVTLACLPFSGCFDSLEDDGPDDGIRYGLGLDTSQVPPPAPLVENRTELAHLFAFANASLEPMFSRCGTTTSKESWVHGRAAASDLEAFVILADACDETDRERMRAEADAARANGTEEAVYSHYLEQLDAVL